jgi:hypothetical protein
MTITSVDRTRTEPAEPGVRLPSFDRAIEVLAVAAVYAVMGALYGGLVGLLPILTGEPPWGAGAMAGGAAVGAVAGGLLGAVSR